MAFASVLGLEVGSVISRALGVPLFTTGDVISLFLAIGAFLGLWWKIASTVNQMQTKVTILPTLQEDVEALKNLTARVTNLETRVNEHDLEQSVLLSSLNKVVTQLAVLESSLRDTREERVRYHTETQLSINELRKDVTRMLSAIGQIRNLRLPETHD